ncbi:hypothetical protein GUITHDRAFT_112977 [Guillardia theta CCMP2712]|uniref:Uncharacterized protein n=1 Tax=Guillardia theta (strain CCMP2712) TaxID=905079 RepID=L1IXH4_GUITC|nr:hypothetical protein GUITHDRAFT_112977 [Guillardia theta CCMP2712]EKX40973.1 hypothetical protein GUITHDRAFT_112977 [Guillardia theta CCMP2712]|eukprot:XP_005827953.1 hypothetical protein GUITHDRAFT_112977 [Guillardia theta CCMP2712]
MDESEETKQLKELVKKELVKEEKPDEEEELVKEEDYESHSPIDQQWIEEFMDYIDDESGDEGRRESQAASSTKALSLPGSDHLTADETVGRRTKHKKSTMGEEKQETSARKMLHEQLIDQHRESVRKWQEQVVELSTLSQYSSSNVDSTRTDS